MFFWLKIGAFAVVLGIIGGIYYKYEHALSENKVLTDNNKVLTQTVHDQDETITQQKSDNDKLQRLLARKAKKEKDLNDQVSKLRSTISDLETQDPVVKTWASELIPPSVIDSLRNSGLSNSDQGNKAASTSNPSIGNPATVGGPQVQPGSN